MPINLPKELPVMPPVAGVRLAAGKAGIKPSGQLDLAVIEIASEAKCAAVFTQNAFCAAPVTIARQHLSNNSPRYLLINSGNANAGTGELGLQAALDSCSLLAVLGECNQEQVLPFSTGVIGELLPVGLISDALPSVVARLDENGWSDAAHAIMTTDTVAKGISQQFQIDGVTVTITGMAKGSGMICPNMATLLAFVACDAPIAEPVLKKCIEQAVSLSFNSITVDGDTSTNDACVLIATGAAAMAEIDSIDSAAYATLLEAVSSVFMQLAQTIVRDAEGVTKFITVDVEQGSSIEECHQVAYTVAHSPLVKTAFFASDANWGRILAAIGRAGIDALNVESITIFLDDVCIVSNGGRDPGYREEQGAEVMRRDEITVKIMLGRGDFDAQIWTSDLSHDYVRINAEYRT